MAKKRAPRPYGGGTLTAAMKRSMIIGALRRVRWPCKYQALKNAYVGRLTNTSTGRLAKHYQCAVCGQHFPAKGVQIDHIEPVIPFTGFDSWEGVIARMFCETDGFQVLCLEDHTTKTKQERTKRNDAKRHQTDTGTEG